MDALKIPITTVTGLELEVDAVVSGKELRPPGADDIELGDIAVKGSLKEVGEEYLFRGTVSGTYLGRCARCLEPLGVPFEVDVIWNFAQGTELEGLEEFTSPEGEGEAEYQELDPLRAFEGNEINLAGHVWEEIVLAIPSKFLCTPDCKGLCPQCGANLNLDPCTCTVVDTPEKNDSSFAELRDLFPDLTRETPEE